VRDCKNVEKIVDNDVDNRKRESIENKVTNVAVDSGTELGTFQQQFDNTFNLVGETLSEARNFGFVVRCGV
jgi:hypothetical protein